MMAGARIEFPGGLEGTAVTAVVLGSGLSPRSWPGEVIVSREYAAIDAVAVPTVKGHPGKLLLLETEGGRLLIFSGRPHFYEGAGWNGAGSAVALAARLGCRRIVLTQAAGSLRRSLPIGSWLLPSDVVSMPWAAPLRKEAKRPEISPKLRHRLELTASAAGLSVSDGILYWTAGPAYETPAEGGAAVLAGADAATMSPLPELAAAAEGGMEAACMSFISNFAPNVSGDGTGHAKVLVEGRKAAAELSRIIPLLAKM